MKEKIYRYQLKQDGAVVASVESPDREQALKEINHYAFIYGQDGPVEIVGLKGEK